LIDTDKIPSGIYQMALVQGKAYYTHPILIKK